MSTGIQCKVGENTPVKLSKGQSVVVEAVGSNVPDKGWLDFGLYGKGDTLVAASGVTMAGDDYKETGVLTNGPSGLAHLYTQDRNITITAGDQDLGEFFVVLKIPTQTTAAKMASHQQKA
jgi:hypothetical protein